MFKSRKRSAVRRIAAATTPVLLGLLLAGPALATTQRYASITGTSSDPCTQASPCDIVTAINNAAADEDVTVEPGTYTVSTSLVPNANGIDVSGAVGEARPVIDSTSFAAFETDAAYSTTVTDLDIEDSTSDADGIYLAGGTVSQLLVRTTGAGSDACELGGTVTISNSVCDGAGTNNTGIGDSATACDEQIDDQALINTDGFGTGSGDGLGAEPELPGCTLEIALTNTLLRGGPTGEDVLAEEFDSSNSIITASHSDYARVMVTGADTLTPAGTDTNIEGDPVLVNPGGENFAETASSPTIDAGLTAAGDGSYDLNGSARSEGGLTDIGALEYTANPAVTAAGASGVTATGATLAGTVNPGNETTTYTFDYGTTTALGQSTAPQTLPAGVATQSVSATLSGLGAGTTYYWELVASNAQGSSPTAIGSFATIGAPGLSLLALAPSKFLAAKTGASIAKVKRPKVTGATISYDDSQSGTTTFTVQRRRPGVKQGGLCVVPPKHRKGKRLAHCTRLVTVGSFTNADAVGANAIHFTGRVGGHTLKPGGYVISAVPVDAYGLTGAAVTVSFRIERRR